MTKKEAGERYRIPEKIQREYEALGFCTADTKDAGGCYGEQDIERIGLMMTLHEIGFNSDEVENYMRLTLEGAHTKPQRMEMLNKKRGKTLDEIHFKEKQLSNMDYLRYEMQKNEGTAGRQ